MGENLAANAIARFVKILESEDVEERIPILVDHNDDITAGAFAITMACEVRGEGWLDAVKIACETLFMMGYRAAKDDTPIPDAFKD